MSNRYSSFPDSLDELKLLPEVQELTADNKKKIARYNELVLKSSLTSAESIELQNLINETKGFQLNSSDWNKTNGVLMATQKYIKENILGDVGVLVDNAELEITNSTENAKGIIEGTKTEATNEINLARANTLLELSQKVADVVANGQVGIDYFKGRTVLDQPSTTVTIGVPEYNRNTDFLMVFINGLLGVEGTNYVIQNDNYSIKGVGGSWTIGDEFDFVVMKKTVVLLKLYDAGLFANGSIRKEKLTQALQDEISKVNTIESSLGEFKTATNSSLEQIIQQKGELINLQTTEKANLVGAINEVFQTGNNVKANTVSALLSVDNTLPITGDSAWNDIITQIGNITLGKKWASGTISYVKAVDDYLVQNLGFTPEFLIFSFRRSTTNAYTNGTIVNYPFFKYSTTGLATHIHFTIQDGTTSGVRVGSAGTPSNIKIIEDGFCLMGASPSANYFYDLTWIAFE